MYGTEFVFLLEEIHLFFFSFHFHRVDLLFSFIFRFCLEGTGSLGWILIRMRRLPCLKVLMLIMCWLIILTGITRIICPITVKQLSESSHVTDEETRGRVSLRHVSKAIPLVRRNASTGVRHQLGMETCSAEHSGNA